MTDRQSLLQDCATAQAEADAHRSAARRLEIGAAESPEPEKTMAAAREATRLGEEAERRAADLLEEYERLAAEEQVEEASPEQEAASLRRAWFLPGSVAEDPMLQFEEAQHGGILVLTAKYAARSVFDAVSEGRVHPESIAARLKTAIVEGARPVGVLDQVARQAERRPGSVFEAYGLPGESHTDATKKTNDMEPDT